MKTQINNYKKAYLLSREYALAKKEPNSTRLMLEAQKNMLQAFIEWLNTNKKHGIVPFGMTADKIMNYGSQEYRKKITDITLKYDW